MKASDCNHAVIMLYKGGNLSDYMIGRIAQLLITNGICEPEHLSISYLDSEGISKALIKDNISSKIDVPVVSKENNDEGEAVKQAVVYIGTRFKDALKGSPLDVAPTFTIELIAAMQNSNNEELRTAIEILSTVDAIVPPALARKYHFTQTVVNIIKKVYNTYCHNYVS